VQKFVTALAVPETTRAGNPAAMLCWAGRCGGVFLASRKSCDAH
jgi:hypothetical protein